MPQWYVGKNTPKTNNKAFEDAKEVIITAEKPMIENRRFERRNVLIACKSYNKNEDIPENKEFFLWNQTK